MPEQSAKKAKPEVIKECVRELQELLEYAQTKIDGVKEELTDMEKGD